MNTKLFLTILVILISLPSVFAVNATSSVYNLTPSSNENDIVGFVKTVNDMTNKLFMTGVLLVIFVIFFVGLLRFGTSDALLASGFITTVITIMFLAIDLAHQWVGIMIILSYGVFFAYRIVKG